MVQRIQFQETSTSPTEFLHELNDPGLLRNRQIPPIAAIELRKQQIAKLRQNIVILVEKREEFNRKMQDYIGNLEALIRSLEQTMALEIEKAGMPAAPACPGTRVRCLRCETERVFRELEIIFARESDESMALPTEVYVLAEGTLKKGHFLCGSCGPESLVIRAG